jgi:hypothetical protein
MLTRCGIEFMPDRRAKLAKLYAAYKLLELLRFKQFRGLPA